MTRQGGHSAHCFQVDANSPESTAPIRNPDHMLASMPARRRWAPLDSVDPGDLGSSAAARWPPIRLRVPVTKVRLTGSEPILDTAGFIMPMATLMIAISRMALAVAPCSRAAAAASSPAIRPNTTRCDWRRREPISRLPTTLPVTNKAMATADGNAAWKAPSPLYIPVSVVLPLMNET